MTDNTGGLAFPITIDLGQGVEWHKGMTLRDYFAAHATERDIGWYITQFDATPAEARYRMADDMLKARDAK